MNKLLPYQTEDIIEVGIDEAGRGTFLGPVYIAGVILPNNIIELCEEENIIIKDSKKLSKKKRELACDFIKSVALDYSIISKDNNIIDQKNIFATTMEGMHDVIKTLSIKPDKILVDGDEINYVKAYKLQHIAGRPAILELQLLAHKSIICEENTEVYAIIGDRKFKLVEEKAVPLADETTDSKGKTVTSPYIET